MKWPDYQPEFGQFSRGGWGPMVHHDAVDDRHEVAAEDPVALGVELEAHGGGFERSTTGVILGRVISQQAERADIRAGGVAGRRGADGPQFPAESDGIHVGYVGDFEGRLPAGSA